MSATGLVYLTGSFAALFAPSLTPVIEPLYLIPFVAETAFAVRLVRRGLSAPTTAVATVRPVPAAA
jgi:hypothetical protein